VVQTDNAGAAALKTQIDSGNVQWDVVEDAQFQADSGCGTLYEKIPDIDRSQIDPKYVTNECGVPIVKFSFVLAYNSKKYKTAPTSIGDFTNTKDFPGKRGLSDSAVNGGIEAALLGSGVPADKLYPLDYQKAIEQLGAIKGDLVFFKTFAEMQDALASGNIDMALIPNGRAYNASVNNPDVKVVWANALTLFDNALLVKGAPNAEAAKAFLGYVAQADTQIALSTIFPYGVLTSGGVPAMPAALQPFFPDDPANASQLLYQDQKWWAENQDAVSQAWTTFISG
jgi:putative spermidine/putrescine transport system substrate-binding protein